MYLTNHSQLPAGKSRQKHPPPLFVSVSFEGQTERHTDAETAVHTKTSAGKRYPQSNMSLQPIDSLQQTIGHLISLPLVAGLFTLLTIRYTVNTWNRWRDLPPGPMGLPILGYIPFLPDTYGDTLTTLFNKYGEVLSLRLGSIDVVFLADYELIKQSFLKDAFNNRPSFSFFSSVLPSSLADWNGEEWREQRKFSVRVFKQLGVGKQVVEDRILDEIDVLFHLLRQEQGRPVDVIWPIGSSINNVVNLLITGERFDAGHPTRELLDKSFLVREKLPSILGTLNYLPAVSRLLQVLPFTPIGRFKEQNLRVADYIMERMRTIRQSFDPRDGDVNCFLEAYLKEMMTESSGKFFDDRHMIGCAFTFFAAASATTGDFLVWFLLYMTVFPEVQEKLRREVDEVVGDNRVSASFKHNMPYTEAVMQELMRHVSPAPIGLIHAVAEDVTLGKYNLPKGTHVIIANFRVHENPKFFPEPEKFKPERFISKDGKFVRDEHVMPFGYGRRSCPGEPIAHMEVFLFVVSFIQAFVIKAPAGRTYTTDGIMEFIGRNPKDAPVHVVFEKREKN